MSRVVGDADADVFSGLAITLGPLGRERFLPSERVRAIWPERVDVDLTAGEVDELPPFEEERIVHVRPDTGRGFLRRLFRRS